MFKNIIAVSEGKERPWLSYCNGERWEEFGIQYLSMINAQQWIHQSLKKIVYLVVFHIEVGLKTKLAGDIFKNVFSYI